AAEATPDSLELAVLVFIKRSHGSDAAVVSRRVFEEYSTRRGESPESSTAEGAEERRETRREGSGPTVRVRILSENRVATISVEDYVLGVLSVEASVEDEIE